MTDALSEVARQTAVMMARFDSHEKDDERRFASIKDAFKESAENFSELRQDQKKQTWYLTLIIGGLIALSRLPDVISVIHGGKL